MYLIKIPIGSGKIRFRRSPSMPEATIDAKLKYGFAQPSMDLNSKLLVNPLDIPGGQAALKGASLFSLPQK